MRHTTSVNLCVCLLFPEFFFFIMEFHKRFISHKFVFVFYWFGISDKSRKMDVIFSHSKYLQYSFRGESVIFAFKSDCINGSEHFLFGSERFFSRFGYKKKSSIFEQISTFCTNQNDIYIHFFLPEIIGYFCCSSCFLCDYLTSPQWQDVWMMMEMYVLTVWKYACEICI